MRRHASGTLHEIGGQGARFALAGRPLHAGDPLELRIEDDRWIPVRYGWSTPEATGPVVLTESGGARRRSLRVPPDAQLRWAQ